MKKILITAVCALFAALMLTAAVSADTVASGECGDNLTWVLYSDGELTIDGTGEMWDFASSSDVPWYSYQKQMLTVTVSDGVTSIGDRAFRGCMNFTSVTIHESVTDIGDYAFYASRSLTGVTIPDGVRSIGKMAFCDCMSLASVTIPASVTGIGSTAFSGCTSLTTVTIPDGVTSIGAGAFNSCTSLTTVTIPESVTSIGASAFGACTNLTKATIHSRTVTFSVNTFAATHPDFAIHGYTGSTAEAYATANSHPFIPLDAKVTHGDADGNGKTNAIDLAYLQRYLAGWTGYGEDAVNLAALDLNGDSKVNPLDAAILARHLANWIGYETIPLTN